MKKKNGKVKFKDLALVMCDVEAGPVQVDIAQMSETLGKLCDLIYANPNVMICLLETGAKRHAKARR